MIDHVDIRVSDRAAAERFYATVLPVLGKERVSADGSCTDYRDFAFHVDGPPTRNLHIAFYAPTTELVDAFWQAGTAAGFTDDGAPGPRRQYGPDYYGGFLRDPDGNSVEAVTSTRALEPGAIDHLWLRSPDLAAIKAFYETLGPYAGFGLGDDEPDRVQFQTGRGSFSFVTGGPLTEHVHIAFAVEPNAAVDAFHAAALAAGYRSNGRPGERAHYHPGYYGAFVLDPDGHNIEAVNHNR